MILMSKERLNKIEENVIVDKAYYGYLDGSKGHWGKSYTLREKDYRYLIEQAKRVQELENVNRVLQKANEGLKRDKERLREQIENVKNRRTPYLTHPEDEMDYLVSRVKELEQQNKRYRELLEKVRRLAGIDREIDYGLWKLIDKELGGG